MKYMGGKLRIANSIATLINQIAWHNNIKNYYEPFVGGAAVIELIKCENRYGSDINKYQIALLKHLQANRELPDYITKEEWIDIRDNKDKHPEWLVGFVGTVCSFRGVWFSGYLVDRWERKDNKVNDMITQFNNQVKKEREVEKLYGIHLEVKHYLEKNMINNSIIYCDPPYINTTDYGTDFNHIEFYNWCIDKSIDNLVIVSEYQMPIDRFQCIQEIKLSNGLGSKEKIEKLFIVKCGWLTDTLFSNDMSLL